MLNTKDVPDSPGRSPKEHILIGPCSHEAPSPVGGGREEEKGEKPRECLEGINTMKEIVWDDRQGPEDGGVVLPWAKITRADEGY